MTDRPRGLPTLSKLWSQLKPVWFELLLGMSVGFAARFLVGADPGIAFVTGFLAYLAIAQVRLATSVRELSRGYERQDAFINGLLNDDVFSELRLLHGLRHPVRVSEEMVEVAGADAARKLWRDCIARTRTRWLVLTYASSADCWELGWSESVANSIQRERIGSNCSIKRVFLVDTLQELEQVRGIARKQHEFGIEVSWLLRERLMANAAAHAASEVLPTLDVALVDTVLTCQILLDSTRHVTGAVASKSRADLNAVETLTREALQLSEQFVFVADSRRERSVEPRADNSSDAIEVG